MKIRELEIQTLLRTNNIALKPKEIKTDRPAPIKAEKDWNDLHYVADDN
jgi:hypothetical protein